MKFTILGCGNSTGVPAIGNVWGACDPGEPKNRRTRSSLLVESKNTKIVIDTGPDFSAQLTKVNSQTIDAVLYTHTHGDHINGIDELRLMMFRNKKLTPIYGSKETLDELKERFAYLFTGGKVELYPPVLQPVEIKDFGVKHSVNDVEFIPFEQNHGSCISTGYRFGDVAYSVDFWRLDDKAVEALKGVRIWIADAAAYKDTANKVHASLEIVFDLNKKIGAEKVYLTSLSLGMDYKTLRGELPEGFEPAWDGLSFEA